MTSVSQVLMIFIAAFALILFLFIFKSLWTIVREKYQHNLTNKRIDPSSPNSTNFGIAPNENLRIRQIPSISSQLQPAQGIRNNRMISASANRQTFPRSALVSRIRNPLNDRPRPNRLEVLPSRNQNPSLHCHCSSHRNNISGNSLSLNQSTSQQQVFKIVLDSPPSYDEATHLPTFEESQKYIMENEIAES